jgi:hypothetical protein
VIELFRTNFSEAPVGSQSKWSLSTHNVLDPDKVAETVAKLRGQPDAAFGVFTYPRKGLGSGPPRFVASAATHAEAELFEKLNAIAQIVSKDHATVGLDGMHRLVGEAREIVKKHLREALV